MVKSKTTQTATSLTDLLDITKQTTNFIKIVTDIGKDINAIKEHNYKILNLDFDKIKGKSVKELVGSIVGVATSMMDRIKADYDIFDIGNEITKYEQLLKEYSPLVPNKTLIANVEKALAEFRDSLKSVYRNSRAGEAYKLIVNANDLLMHIDILGYSLAQLTETAKVKKANKEEAKANKASKTNKAKSKQGRKKKVKQVVSSASTEAEATTSEPIVSESTASVESSEAPPEPAPEVNKPKRGRPKKAAAALATNEASEPITSEPTNVESSEAPPEAAPEVNKSKRGRPKKAAAALATSEASEPTASESTNVESSEAQPEAAPEVNKPKRGRPKKAVAVLATSEATELATDEAAELSNETPDAPKSVDTEDGAISEPSATNED